MGRADKVTRSTGRAELKEPVQKKEALTMSTTPSTPSAQKDDNPLREGVRLEKSADPCTVVIFGASGDLTKRKLVPALYRLTQERLLPAEFAIVGFARSPMSDEDFRNRMKDAVLTFSDAHEVDDAVWDSFAKGLFY